MKMYPESVANLPWASVVVHVMTESDNKDRDEDRDRDRADEVVIERDSLFEVPESFEEISKLELVKLLLVSVCVCVCVCVCDSELKP